MEKITAVVLAVIGVLCVATNAGDVVQTTPSQNATTLGNNNTMLSVTTRNSPASHVSNHTTPVNGRNVKFTTLTNTSASPNPVTQNNRSDGVSQPANNTSPKPRTTPRSITKKSTPGPDKPTTTTKSQKPKISTTKSSTTSSTTFSTRSSTKSPNKSGNSNTITYVIIFIIVILCLLGAVVYCCFFQNKTRRFSLDHHSKNEDAQIPLSTVEPEVFEASPPKDMQTFSAPPEEVKNQEEEKAAEANPQEKDSSVDTQATLPLTEKPDELTVVDLNDGGPDISTKTSVESLDEPLNENNSNNRAREYMYNFNGQFTEIRLDDEL